MPASISLKRFWFLNFSVGIVFVLVVYQIVQLTVIRQAALFNAAQRQHHLVITVPPLRGSICDRSGKEFATNLKVPSVYAVPRMLAKEEKYAVAKVLAPVLDLHFDFVLNRLLRDKAFVWIKRKVSIEEAEKVCQLKNPALGYIEEYKRFYPQGDLLAHVLGFTNIDNQGLEGIELSLNHELQGREGKRHTKRDALGREIKAFEARMIPAVNGHRVILCIDQYLQYLTERALEASFSQWHAKGASAILMAPYSGEILAMANRPTFDPNRFESSTLESRRNRAITDMYEPGSVFKIVAASAALNEGVATLANTFYCENGSYRYGSKVLRDVHPYGQLSFSEVLIKSSNIGTVKIAALLKPQVFQKYIEGYGFGRPTGFDLPGEVTGFTRPPAQWSKTSPFNIPIGHEVLVTALQMVRSYCVIANGGNLVTPFIVSQIQDQTGVVLREKRPHVVQRVVSSETSKIMRDILVRVIEEGTGKRAKIEGLLAGGKTGTAQKVNPGGRGYSHGNFISSFVGFAPAENPLLVMVVMVDDPHPSYYGGTVAAPVFKEVIEAGLLHMGYVPSNAKRLETVSASAPDVRGN